MLSLSVQSNQDNPNIKICLARLRIIRPGRVAVQGVNSSAEQALNTLALQTRAFFHQEKKKHLSGSSLTGYGVLVKLPSVLSPTLTRPLRCQTLTGGKKLQDSV